VTGRAACAAVWRLVPRPVRRIMGFDAKGMASLLLWIIRRRDGVPPGATALPYAREQAAILLVLVFGMAVETVAAELLLRAIGAPDWLRLTILAVDVYSLLVGLAIAAAYVTRPHVVTPGELRIRYGAFFDLRIPAGLIVSARLVRSYSEAGMVKATEGILAVAVGSQTNVVLELAAPVTAVRPLGRTEEVHTIRFFCDDPAAALAALRTQVAHAA
jgi:hypothetical protein